jgi:hypothetical protein
MTYFSNGPTSPPSFTLKSMAAIASDHSIGDDFVMIEGADNDELWSDHLSAISDFVDELSQDVRTISLEIHDHPELQYKEHHAHKVLTEYLRIQSGWSVTPSAYGIETAFVATYDSKKAGPVVS